MIVKLTFGVILVLSIVYCKRKIKSKEDLEFEEDILILQKSVATFGPPQPHQKYELPGPEVKVREEKMFDESLLRGNSKNFTYRLRTVSGGYSFTRHYETVEIRVIDNKTISIVRGQVTEEIPRVNGGVYLRTIGYIFNEHGFRNFLIDITKIESVSIKSQKVPIIIEARSNFPEPKLHSSVLSSRSGCWSENICSELLP